MTVMLETFQQKSKHESNDVQDVSNDNPTCPSKSKSKSKSKSNINISIPKEFDILWSIYPPYRRQGKKKALESYRKARRAGVTFEEVKDGIEAYVRYIEAERIEDKYVKQASTFFSQCAWDSEWVSRKMAQGTDDLDGII